MLEKNRKSPKKNKLAPFEIENRGASPIRQGQPSTLLALGGAPEPKRGAQGRLTGTGLSAKLAKPRWTDAGAGSSTSSTKGRRGCWGRLASATSRFPPGPASLSTPRNVRISTLTSLTHTGGAGRTTLTYFPNLPSSRNTDATLGSVGRKPACWTAPLSCSPSCSSSSTTPARPRPPSGLFMSPASYAYLRTYRTPKLQRTSAAGGPLTCARGAQLPDAGVVEPPVRRGRRDEGR